uniref:Uncharacterized protein n=1 Tax=Brugia timori TaxID=42155 RepID=A0A0R3QH83_9BILA
LLKTKTAKLFSAGSLRRIFGSFRCAFHLNFVPLR